MFYAMHTIPMDTTEAIKAHKLLEHLYEKKLGEVKKYTHPSKVPQYQAKEIGKDGDGEYIYIVMTSKLPDITSKQYTK